MEKFHIQKVDTERGFSDVQRLHRSVWNLHDLDVLPVHILRAIQNGGGLIFCAYYEGQPVGFSFSFCGLHNNKTLCLYMHNIGVIEDFRNKGIGYRVALAQRDGALSKSIELIKWTFDPLVANNAHLYLNKLGCICREYVRDYYGTGQDWIMEDVPSDRLMAEWWLTNEEVIKRIDSSEENPEQESLVSEIILDPLQPSDHVESLIDGAAHSLYIKIPQDYHALEDSDVELARRWRHASRRTFEVCFAKGFVGNDFLMLDDGYYYALRRAP